MSHNENGIRHEFDIVLKPHVVVDNGVLVVVDLVLFGVYSCVFSKVVSNFFFIFNLFLVLF